MMLMFINKAFGSSDNASNCSAGYTQTEGC